MVLGTIMWFDRHEFYGTQQCNPVQKYVFSFIMNSIWYLDFSQKPTSWRERERGRGSTEEEFRVLCECVCACVSPDSWQGLACLS